MVAEERELNETRLEFEPAWKIANGHLQTLIGTYLRSPTLLEDQRHEVQLDDGDRILLFENRPKGPAYRTALLLHGLGGCNESGYMMRVARLLSARGIRTFRIAMRGVGDGVMLANRPMHAGRWPDVAAALQLIHELAPQLPTTMIGFSLGANAALLALGKAGDQHPTGNCDSCIAVSPPANLSKCCEWLMTGVRKVYDRYLLRFISQQLRESWERNPNAVRVEAPRKPKSIYEFDTFYTAPLGGFRDVEHYYSDSSCGPVLSKIRVPTRVLAAEDDPMIPVDVIRSFPRSESTELFVTRSGGHIGFVSSKRQCSNRRWLDELIVRWVCDENDWMSANAHGQTSATTEPTR